MINIQLEENQVNVVLNALAQRPYGEVAAIINAVATQAQARVNTGGEEVASSEDGE